MMSARGIRYCTPFCCTTRTSAAVLSAMRHSSVCGVPLCDQRTSLARTMISLWSSPASPKAILIFCAQSPDSCSQRSSSTPPLSSRFTRRPSPSTLSTCASSTWPSASCSVCAAAGTASSSQRPWARRAPLRRGKRSVRSIDRIVSPLQVVLLPEALHARAERQLPRQHAQELLGHRLAAVEPGRAHAQQPDVAALLVLFDRRQQPQRRVAGHRDLGRRRQLEVEVGLGVGTAPAARVDD